MATQVQMRRGTTAQHSTFTGAVGEITIDTTKDALVVHDGLRAAGFPVQPALEFNKQSISYGIVASDRAKLIEYYGAGGHTFTLADLANLWTGFDCIVSNAGAGTLTLAASGTNLIDGAASIALTAGQVVSVIGDAATGHWDILATRGYAASAINIPFTPAGGIAATNLQAAVEELDGEKAATAGSASQAFSVAPATAATHAAQATQLTNPKVLPVNGGCMIDQVNAGALVTPTNVSYPIDNVQFTATQASKLQTQQITTSLLTLNASHALRTSVLAQYTPIATDAFAHSFPIEGIDVADLQWGTANAKAVSLQFKARASVAGTYSGAIRNAANNRSYPFSFVLAANTDTLVKVENIPGDAAGTWPAGVVAGMYITFDLGTGANFKGAAGTWAAGNYVGVTGSTAFVAQANGSTLDITDVYINEGAFCREYPRQRYADVLRDCQRYLPVFRAETTTHFFAQGGAFSTSVLIANVYFPVETRVAPSSLVISSAAHITGSTTGGTASAGTSFSIQQPNKKQCRVLFTGTGTPYTANAASELYFNNTGGLLYFNGARI